MSWVSNGEILRNFWVKILILINVLIKFRDKYFKQNPVISKVDSIYTIHQTLFEKFGHLSILKVLGT